MPDDSPKLRKLVCRSKCENHCSVLVALEAKPVLDLLAPENHLGMFKPQTKSGWPAILSVCEILVAM